MTPSQQTADTLYRQYRRQIHAYLSRMTGDREEAEDLTQEVFLRAYRQLADNREPDNTRAWLFRVAACTCFDHFRRLSRRVRTDLIRDDLQLASTVDPFEQSQSATIVVASLRRLSKRHRAALILKDVYGFRHAEIAAAMRISEGAAQILLHRARNEFRQAYADVLAGRTRGCPVSNLVALNLVGTSLTPAQRRDLKKHAETCPECGRRLAGRAVPTGALGFLLPLPPDLGTGAPLLPPPVIAPPAVPSLGAEAVHGVLSQVTSALASKAAIITVATAVAVGGQLATHIVTPSAAGASGSETVAEMSQSPPEASEMMAAGARDFEKEATQPADVTPPVPQQSIAQYWRTWLAGERQRYQVQGLYAGLDAAGNPQTFPGHALAGTTNGFKIGEYTNDARNSESGTTQTTEGNRYAGESGFAAGEQGLQAGRPSEPAGVNNVGNGAGLTQANNQGESTGAAVSESTGATVGEGTGATVGESQSSSDPSKSGVGK